MGTINVEQAIFATNEGQRDFEALSKKLEPKQTELKGQNDEVESLKKQLNTQGEKLNDESRGTLVKQIEQKQKSLERQVQDARDDAQNQQNEIAQRILQKMGPMLVKYAADKGFGVIIDTSNPWPQWAGALGWAGCGHHQAGSRPLQRAIRSARADETAQRARPTTPGATRPSKPLRLRLRRQPRNLNSSIAFATPEAVKRFPQAASRTRPFSFLRISAQNPSR